MSQQTSAGVVLKREGTRPDKSVVSWGRLLVQGPDGGGGFGQVGAAGTRRRVSVAVGSWLAPMMARPRLVRVKNTPNTTASTASMAISHSR